MDYTEDDTDVEVEVEEKSQEDEDLEWIETHAELIEDNS